MEDSSQHPRKHRVIHWNPEDEEAAEKARSSRKRLIGFTITFSVIAVVLFGAISLWENPDEDTKAFAKQLGFIEEAVPERNFQEAFASRSKADLEMESAKTGLEKIRQMRVNHPVLTTKLVSIERDFLQAEELMARTAYDQAFEGFIRVNGQIEEFAQQVEAKNATQEMYDNFLIRVDELKSSKSLNQKAYDDAFDAASAGKQFLMEGSFTASETKLKEATDKLKELEDSIANYLRTNASLGHRYIAQGDGAKAIEAFSNILSINPDNPDALLQIERAKSAGAVFALINEGEAFERNEAFEDALNAFQKAFEQDAKSAKAQNGISRVRRKIENRDFTLHLTTARKAEKEARYDEAISHFQQALAIFPDRKELADAINKAREDKRQTDIANMIRRAYALESENRDWQGARAIYQELLNIDPELQPAKDGLLRTGKVIRSILRYEKYLEIAAIEASPTRRQYQQAMMSWDQAMRSKPEYLELSDEAKRLQQFLITQTKPVEVLFISDMNTWVSIQGPTQQKPTKLDESAIQLLPGQYRIIGRRKNYEDVQIGILIEGGKPQDSITVICKEKSN